MAFCCCWGCNSQGNFSCFPDPRRSRKSWQLTKASFALVNWMNWVETNWEAVIPFVTMFLRQQCLNGQKSSRKGWMGISSYSCMKKKKNQENCCPINVILLRTIWGDTPPFCLHTNSLHGHGGSPVWWSLLHHVLHLSSKFLLPLSRAKQISSSSSLWVKGMNSRVSAGTDQCNWLQNALVVTQPQPCVLQPCPSPCYC